MGRKRRGGGGVYFQADEPLLNRMMHRITFQIEVRGLQLTPAQIEMMLLVNNRMSTVLHGDGDHTSR